MLLSIVKKTGMVIIEGMMQGGKCELFQQEGHGQERRHTVMDPMFKP
jgi:hypothetical protein